MRRKKTVPDIVSPKSFQVGADFEGLTGAGRRELVDAARVMAGVRKVRRLGAAVVS